MLYIFVILWIETETYKHNAFKLCYNKGLSKKY